MRYTKRLTYFTAGYAQAAVVFPFLVAAPRYFSGAIPLGGLTQIAGAFSSVQDALSWFVNAYGTLASWKASVDRLLTFQQALDRAAADAEQAEGIRVEPAPARNLRAEHLDLALPGGDGKSGAVIVVDASLEIEPGERVLVTGPSGSGKSTLFRALAGIWPFGSGKITIPAGARVPFLPQKPYIPIASLRDAITFPSPSGAFADEQIREALRACRLDHFADRLDEVQNWSLSMSVGEQQRLAIARALLNKPEWLFLDEATAALDEATEAHLYGLLRERLPNATLVSIAHRPAVAAFHGKRYALEVAGGRARLAAA